MQGTEKSSLNYWEERWGSKPDSLSTSWPDSHALQLEREALRLFLPKEDGLVVELGCGNLHILGAGLLGARDYIGIEGAKVLRSFNDRVLANRLHLPGHRRIFYRDLTRPRALAGVPDGGYLLTKRTLQNIEPTARRKLLPRLMDKFQHGTIIEDYFPYRENLNILRRQSGLDKLGIPPFNWPLDIVDLELLGAQNGTVIPFMGIYYAVTRNWPDCPYGVCEQAFNLQIEAMRSSALNLQVGPLVMVQW